MWDPMKNKPTLDPVIKTLCSTRFPLTAAMFALYSLCIIHIPRSRPCCWSAIYEVMQKQRLGDMSCSCSLPLPLMLLTRAISSLLFHETNALPICRWIFFFSLIPITFRLFFLFFFKKCFEPREMLMNIFPPISFFISFFH